MTKFMTPEDISLMSSELLPKDSLIQPSGSSYCGDPIYQFGTLGVRVERVPPTNGTFFIATYHNFEKDGEQGKDFTWLYFNEHHQVVSDPSGNVIDRKYQLGPDEPPLLDCALIQLLDGKKSRRGIYHIVNKNVSTTVAATDDLVVKYGMTTGLTYGRVLPLPSSLNKSYNDWIFFIENTNKYGLKIGGSFAEAGDSGAPVMVMRGSPDNPTYWIAGMIIQSTTTGLGIASRIGQIEAALHVKVYTKP